MGATSRATCGNSSIEKIAAAGEDDVPKNLDKVRGGDRVDHDEAMRAVKITERFLSPNLRPARARIHSVRAVVCFKERSKR